jgi:hypothetical protein
MPGDPDYVPPVPVVAPPWPPLPDALSDIVARAALPYPAHTDLLGDTDVFIHNLATAVETRLGATAYWISSAVYSTNANGDANVYTDLTQVVGAVIGTYYAPGVPITVPTLAVIGAGAADPRLLWVRCYNPTSSAVQANASVGLSVYAWGTR